MASATGRTWGGFGAIRLDLSIDEVALPPAPYHAVLVNVGQPYRLEEKLDGRVVPTSGVRGDVAVVPAGLPLGARTRERVPQRVETRALLLPPPFLRGVVANGDHDPAGIELLGALGARDPAIERSAAPLEAARPYGPLCTFGVGRRMLAIANR